MRTKAMRMQIMSAICTQYKLCEYHTQLILPSLVSLLTYLFIY